MAVEYKDYYKILGVEKKATEDEIRKAFRKLARQYHPDVAKNKTQAEEKFKEINEAYEVLGDPEKRRKYDELGPAWKQGAGFRPPPGWQSHRTTRGGGPQPGGFEYQFGGTGFSDFFEQLFGSMRGGGFGSRGSQDFSGAEFSERGRDSEADLMVTLEEAARGAIRPITLQRTTACPKCGGTGETGGKVCPVCEGTGQQSTRESYKVKIPPGVREGQRLRLAGRGEAGVGEAPAGDLFLRVRLAKHPDLRVEEGDLYYDLNLAPWEAVLGTKVSVPALEGRVNIKIPAGTQNGQKMRIRGHGMPDHHSAKGDLFVVVKVQLPETVSEKERALWEQLSRESDFNPRE